MASFTLKLDRALEHIGSLNHEVGKWLAGEPYRLIRELDPESGENVLFLELVDPVPMRFGLLIGDCVQNMRAALDHLALSLANANSEKPLPTDVAEASEFPIFSKRPVTTREWQSWCRKVKGISLEAQAIVERLQPYQREDAFRADPLWRLHELSRIDKHRSLHLTVITTYAASVTGDNLQVEGLEVLGSRMREGRAEVARYRVRPTNPDADVHVNARPLMFVAFDDLPPTGLGGPVGSALHTIFKYIRDAVVPPLNAFL